jgi:hypothetical protein
MNLGGDPAEAILRWALGFVWLFGLGLVGGLGFVLFLGLGSVGGLVGGGLGLAAGRSVAAVGACGAEVVPRTRTAGDDALVTPRGG